MPALQTRDTGDNSSEQTDHFRDSFTATVAACVSPNWLNGDCVRRCHGYHGRPQRDAGRVVVIGFGQSYIRIQRLIPRILSYQETRQNMRVPLIVVDVYTRQAGQRSSNEAVMGVRIRRESLVMSLGSLPLLPVVGKATYDSAIAVENMEREREAENLTIAIMSCWPNLQGHSVSGG